MLEVHNKVFFCVLPATFPQLLIGLYLQDMKAFIR